MHSIRDRLDYSNAFLEGRPRAARMQVAIKANMPRTDSDPLLQDGWHTLTAKGRRPKSGAILDPVIPGEQIPPAWEAKYMQNGFRRAVT